MFELSEQDVFRLVEMFTSSDTTFLHVKADNVEVLLSRGSAGELMPGVSTETSPSVTMQPSSGPVPSQSPGVPTSDGQRHETAAAPAGSADEGPGAAEPPTDLVTVPASTLGTFYSAPRPDLPPYVEVGAVVEPETTVALIEAMKVFTGVSAGAHGTVVEVLVENGDFVEYGQPLFRLRPLSPNDGAA